VGEAQTEKEQSLPPMGRHSGAAGTNRLLLAHVVAPAVGMVAARGGLSMRPWSAIWGFEPGP